MGTGSDTNKVCVCEGRHWTAGGKDTPQSSGGNPPCVGPDREG